MSSFETAFEAVLGEVGKAIDAFPFESELPYLYWLAQTYYYSRHTTRLLSLAASRIQLDDSRLHQRMVRHVREEMNHEILAIRDIRDFGHELAEIPELSETKAFYQTQYYWIEHQSPVSFFGFILILEALAVSKGAAVSARTQKAFGPKAASFLSVHAQEDKDHVREALEHIAALSDDDRKNIMNNLVMSAKLYTGILTSITRLNDKHALKATRWPSDPMTIQWRAYFNLM
jgi:pyrroloquinoline quinone (PQQ) biosynthesis protein C